MSEFMTERVADPADYGRPSPLVDKRTEMALLATDKDFEDSENEQEIRSESDHGEDNSEECVQSFIVELDYNNGDSAKLERGEPPADENKGNCSSDPDVKPTHSYIALIAMAILSCPNKKMILGDIYQYISDNFPYYRNKDKSWRNSIRHNLSLNECFIKAGRSENGKGNYWAIHPANLEDFANGDFRRRRARRRVRRSNPLKFAGSSPQSAYFRGLSSFSSHSSFYPYRGDEYRMYPSLKYIRPTKKSFAIDSIMGSYDSSYLYSPVSVRSYPSLSLHGSRDYPGAPPTHSFLFHTSPTLVPCVSEFTAASISACATNSLESSAFSAYLGSKGIIAQGQNSRPESWQDTLSKLQEQLRKVTPWKPQGCSDFQWHAFEMLDRTRKFSVSIWR